MTFAQAVFHFFGFILPALALAVLMPLAGRWVMGAGAMYWPRRVFWHLLTGVLVLVAGLVLQGQDGEMSTYAVLIGVAGTLEWALHRGWRRG
jgi:hypothetical protein